LHSWSVCTMPTVEWRWQCWKWHDFWISCELWGKMWAQYIMDYGWQLKCQFFFSCIQIGIQKLFTHKLMLKLSAAMIPTLRHQRLHSSTVGFTHQGMTGNHGCWSFPWIILPFSRWIKLRIS
jgi:hypothetical protein